MFVVTGGGSGIGRALAHELARRNRQVLIVGRREALLTETAQFSPLIQTLVSDVAAPEQRQTILDYLNANHITGLTGLVHNAGIIDPIVPVASIDAKSWQQVMATNLDAPLFLNQMLQDKLVNARVLHVGSGAAYFPVTGWAAYCVSKAALSMLTRCWQLESENTAYASVMPGIIDTPMQALIRNAPHMDTAKKDFFLQLHQGKQLVSSETVALFLAWLLLDVDKDRYVSKEWDIYDQLHHPEWLVAPHCVPPLE